MSELALIMDRNRARSRRKKRSEEPKIDPNRDPTTLDLVFAEAAAATTEVRYLTISTCSTIVKVCYSRTHLSNSKYVFICHFPAKCCTPKTKKITQRSFSKNGYHVQSRYEQKRSQAKSTQHWYDYDYLITFITILYYLHVNYLFIGQSFQAPSFKMVIMRPKMDLNRALRIMGYTSSKEVSKQIYL